jgi:GNAT superfamily N-acetyltransferase
MVIVSSSGWAWAASSVFAIVRSRNVNTIQLATASDGVAVSACVRDAYEKYVERIGRRPAPMDANYAELIAAGDVYVLRGPQPRDLYGLIVIRAEQGALFVENVAVQPTQQGQGFGRQLMAFAEDRAHALGVPEIRLYTHERMTENMALYTRLGYMEVDRRVEHGFARVFMRKVLP